MSSTSSSKFASQLTFEFTMGCVPTFLDGDCVVSPLEAARLGVCRIPYFSRMNRWSGFPARRWVRAGKRRHQNPTP